MNKFEKASLVLAGIELAFVAIGIRMIKKQSEQRAIKAMGITINEMMNAKTVEEYKTLKREEA